MSCWDVVADYGLRSLGIGERLLPRDDFTLCKQVVLIGSGMIWNIYFGTVALLTGFFLATAVALGKASDNRVLRKASEWFIFVFRGSPLFIQFFFAYFLFLSLKSVSPIFDPFSAAWLGALIVLFLNTAAYSGEIFYGALLSVPKGDIEAADAYGFSGWPRFRRIVWPTMLGGSKTARFTDYPHGDWRVWYFAALLVFYLCFTRVSEIVLGRLMTRLTHGQATMGGEAQRKAA